jgi:hypothetical protein
MGGHARLRQWTREGNWDPRKLLSERGSVERYTIREGRGAQIPSKASSERGGELKLRR